MLLPGVSKSGDEMSRFLTRVNEDLAEECRSAMIRDNMDLSRLMVHVKYVEENRKKKGARDVRSPRPLYQVGQTMESTKILLASVRSLGSRRGNKVLGILTLTGL